MTTREDNRGPAPKRATIRGVVTAAILVVAGLAVGWLSVRAAVVRALPATAPVVMRLAPDDPDTVLARASADLVARRGVLDTATLDAVRRAAIAAPLDARAYLILGHEQWRSGAPARGVVTLEAGQRLDPRQRLIHLLLLDRYLRTARYDDAAAQFSVLARLLGATQAPIATAMAAMATAPETRDAVRHTLAADPVLERAVLVALARSDTAPQTILALASPAARADARQPASWGPALVDRLVAKRDYAVARSVWQRVYGVPSDRAAALIANPDFRTSTPAPPFDWTLTASGLGAADIRGGGLAIDYYGRDSGVLARQLLVLAPGRYRFGFGVDPGKTDTASKLVWSLACGTADASGDAGRLMNLPVTATAKPRRVATEFVVPANCPAQTLTLRGEAGDFPAPIGVTVRDLDLRAVPGGGA